MLLLAACSTTHKPIHSSSEAGNQTEQRKTFANIGRYTPSKGGNWGKLAADPYRRSIELPKNHSLPHNTAKKNFRRLTRKVRKNDVGITWIGHSTFLMKLGKKWILTDPVFSDRVTPLPPFGPKRLVAPGLKMEDLPKIDAIVISHNHYDHLDLPSLKRLAVAYPDARVFVPLKNGKLVRRAGFHDIVELDWFEESRLGSIKLTAVPAVHSSRRRLSDLNRALWSGWSINTGSQKIYFAGDTADGSFIHLIRKRLGVHRIALVPIGAYAPPHVEEGHHATPEQSVAMARVLGASHIVPMHWGTFALTPEPFTEQRDRYLAAPNRGAKSHLLKIGETILIRR